MTFLRYVNIIYMLATTAFLASAQFEVEYEGGVTANYGKGDIAPYYINSNRGGTLTQQSTNSTPLAAFHSDSVPNFGEATPVRCHTTATTSPPTSLYAIFSTLRTHGCNNYMPT